MSKVDEFLCSLIVCEQPDNVSVSEIQSVYGKFELAKLELTQYVKELMGNDEHYFFELKMPLDAVNIVKVDLCNLDFDIIHLPFATVSSNLWNRLKENPKNPVFQVVLHLAYNVRSIRGMLLMYGVSDDVALTSELLDEYNIMDLLGLYRFEDMYSDVENYL